MITKYIVGSITETELEYIAHGVNCMDKMESGVAKALFEVFPDVKKKYHEYCSHVPIHKRLATVEPVRTQKKTIYNLFTQYNYGNSYKNGQRYVNYHALSHCFKLLSIALQGKTIAIPKIGCGLAGGDWKFVEQLINDTVGHDLEIWVYDIKKEPISSKRNDLG